MPVERQAGGGCASRSPPPSSLRRQGPSVFALRVPTWPACPYVPAASSSRWMPACAGMTGGREPGERRLSLRGVPRRAARRMGLRVGTWKAKRGAASRAGRHSRRPCAGRDPVALLCRCSSSTRVRLSPPGSSSRWMPACAGMTGGTEPGERRLPLRRVPRRAAQGMGLRAWAWRAKRGAASQVGFCRVG